MIVLKYKDLCHLPGQVRRLVADGVWSLYSTEEYPFALICSSTTGEIFLLSTTGEVIEKPTDVLHINDLTILEAVTILHDENETMIRHKR